MKNPAGREELLAAVAAVLLREGASGLSLRPLASACGTSARMLVYQFGSKENLFREALASIRVQLRASLEEWLGGHKASGPAELAAMIWAWAEEPQRRPFLRLFFEVFVDDLKREAAPDHLAFQAIAEWQAWFESYCRKAGWPREQARATAVLLIATLRGLMLHLMATGDRKACRMALKQLTSALRQPQV